MRRLLKHDKLAHGSGCRLSWRYAAPNAFRHGLTQKDGDGVTQLTHSLRPGPMEYVVVVEGLQPRGFSNREVAETAIGLKKSILSAGHAVVASLKSLGGFVKKAPCVTDIAARTRIVLVIVEHWVALRFRARKAAQGVTDGSPGLLFRLEQGLFGS